MASAGHEPCACMRIRIAHQPAVEVLVSGLVLLRCVAVAATAATTQPARGTWPVLKVVRVAKDDLAVEIFQLLAGEALDRACARQWGAAGMGAGGRGSAAAAAAVLCPRGCLPAHLACRQA